MAPLCGSASAAIASGNGALEALAAGRPTLALAYAGVAEPFEFSHLTEAERSNFGAYGAVPARWPGALFDGLYITATARDADFAQQAREFVRAHHDITVFNQ